MNAKKILDVMLCIAMVASVFAVVMPMNVSALPPDEVWVDDDYYDGGFNDGHTWGDDAFAEIQDGINAVAAGGTVNVYAGTYTENVVVDKIINLIGEDRDTTIIDGGGSGNVVDVSVNWVNVSGFAVTGSGWGFGGSGIHLDFVQNCSVFNNNISKNNGYYGIGVHGSNHSITNNIINDTWGSGIAISGGDNNIFGNAVLNNSAGINLWPYCNNSNIIGNNVSDNYYGIDFYHHASRNNIEDNNVSSNNNYGIYLRGASNNTIKNNNVSNNLDGIYVHYYSPLKVNSNNNIIFENLLSYNSNYGIRIDSKCNNNLIYHNNIIDNTNQAHDSNPANNDWHHSTLLEGNYWSDYTGLDDGSGTGKHAIAGDGIGDTYIPHPDTNYDFYPFILPGAWMQVHNIDKDMWYAAIQTAVDDADSSNTLEAMTGTYNESVVVNKTITIIGKNGATNTIINGNGTGDVVYITANWVNLTGFTVTGSGSDMYDAGIEIDNAQNCSITNNNISTNDIGVYVDNFSNIIIEGNTISYNYQGILSDYSSLIIQYNDISYNYYEGIGDINYSNAFIGNNTITHNNGTGISKITYSNATIDNNTISYNILGIMCGESSPVITYNNITNNTNGIECWLGSDPVIHWNNIQNNTEYGVNNTDSTLTINATDNWWGNSSGPYHPITNPLGSGDRVSSYVVYDPWLADPVEEAGPD